MICGGLRKDWKAFCDWSVGLGSAMLITFSGLDGAGKSSLIEFTMKEFAKHGKRAKVLTMYDHVGVYALIRILRDALFGKPAYGGYDLSKSPSLDDTSLRDQSGVFLRAVRSRSAKRVMLFLDLALFRLYRIWYEVILSRTLILDRYFFDSLVDAIGPTKSAYERVALALTPTPSLAVYLDVSPEVSFARKGEYGVHRLEARQRRYLRIFEHVRDVCHTKNEILVDAQADLAREFRGRGLL